MKVPHRSGKHASPAEALAGELRAALDGAQAAVEQARGLAAGKGHEACERAEGVLLRDADALEQRLRGAGRGPSDGGPFGRRADGGMPPALEEASREMDALNRSVEDMSRRVLDLVGEELGRIREMAS